MAVQNKPERPIQRQTADTQRPSIQKAVAQTRPATVNRNVLNNARSVFAHKTPQKPIHAANAKYSTGPRPEASLKSITKDIPNSASGGLPSHSDAVAFLDHFLSKTRKP